MAISLGGKEHITRVRTPRQVIVLLILKSTLV